MTLTAQWEYIPSSSGPIGVGGGSKDKNEELVTVPITGESSGFSVTASISENTATLTEATEEQLEKLLGDNVKTGEVTIDVSALPAEITEVVIPDDTFKAIEAAVIDPKNDADSLTIKLTKGSVTFDSLALSAIAAQMTGDDLRLNLDDVGLNNLNSAQRAAFEDMDVQTAYDVYMTSNGVRISDFRGGRAVVTVTYTLREGQAASGVVVWYAAEDGSITEVAATRSSHEVTFTVQHFSNYVVTYDPTRVEDFELCPKDETCPIWPFADAQTTAWYHDGVHYCLDEGIMSGMGNGLFAPSSSTTRAMMAQIFYNMEGLPASSTEMNFTDVDSGSWYADAVRWATQEGIMEGYGEGLFGPEDPVTREQIVTIVYRYAQYKGRSVAQSSDLAGYDDVDQVSAWAMDAIKWSVGSKTVLGRTDTTLNAKDTAMRSEIATIIMRYCTAIER